jgi:dienelactone hydrolase
LAEEGFITIAFDASYQGESTGEPRQLENPYIRTEDISAVIDYLTTLPYVDSDRIGAMGTCAGGRYTANAAINDRRHCVRTGSFGDCNAPQFQTDAASMMPREYTISSAVKPASIVKISLSRRVFSILSADLICC